MIEPGNHMEIQTGIDGDLASKKPHPGSYEWWYFDGLDVESEVGFTIIFYEGNPFSSRYLDSVHSESVEDRRAASYPALSISVYKSGKPVYYGFQEVSPDRAGFGRKRVEGYVGNSTFDGVRRHGELVYHLSIDQTLPGGDRIVGSLRFTSREPEEGLLKEHRSGMSDSKHQWCLVQPDAKVSGVLKIDGLNRKRFSLSGSGYHDHNVGREAMEKSFSEWYWGRFHFPGQTLIYYLMFDEKNEERRAWLLNSKNGMVRMDQRVVLKDHSWNWAGLKSARKIRLEGEDADCLIQHEHVLDNGPFYQRFQSRAILNLGDTLLQAEGISEYLVPGRISSRLFRPLVDMRIDYPYRAHWVQKRPRLYRWTW